jgi:hypothetical protein
LSYLYNKDVLKRRGRKVESLEMDELGVEPDNGYVMNNGRKMKDFLLAIRLVIAIFR